ncbi:toll/interleukin-1 receptor domain-containing protein [Nocardia rhizosphaerihabitans]|uniref:TIR domain-containing protein n=1 Tax=Nocardia rhizosphaerihabitans TaxID=1691570 RepID=A0ABQ2L2A8_9NOCA|nr:TIR domain-containing protein [Nocardia rhizosphaerihabitans]GGO00229.1 hypothetical protein GCM10011610_68990 [Nocardia rhizosphaerihabitans]
MSTHLEAQLSLPRESFDYDAFISYTHRRDRPVAAGIQKALHRIGRRMGHLHALRVFRDATDLTASPDLWGKVTVAMDRARYLIVVLSPEAAISKWVDREVAHWLACRGSEQLLFVLAGGRLSWDEDTGRFDPDRSDAAPPALTRPGALPTEPFYVDVSDDAPWDPAAPLFREKVTDLAAPIHGKDKYELASDDVRELRRFRRLRRAAIAGLVILTVMALLAAVFAVAQRREALDQRNEAIRQRDTAVALRLATESDSILSGSKPRDDERAILQALASERLGAADPGVLLRTLKRLADTSKIIQVGDPFLSGMAIQPEAMAALSHLDLVWSVAISPDGRRIVAGGAQIRLWDADTGQLIGEPFQSPLLTTSVAFSPDGRRIVSGGTGMQLWDAESHRLIGEFTGHEGLVRSVAFSADAALVASGGLDKTVRIWNAETRQQAGKPISEHGARVDAVAFSPDGRRVVSGSADHSLRIWNTVDQVQAGPPIDVGETVTSVAFSPDNRHVAIADQGGQVRLFDPTTGSAGDPLPNDGRHTGSAVAFSTDGRRLAAGGIGATIHLWDTESRAPRGYATGHTGWVTSLAFSRDDNRLLSGSLDGTARIWHAGTHISGGHRITGPPGTDGLPIPASVAFAPDSRRMVAGYRDGTLWQFETDTGRAIGPPLRQHVGPVRVTTVSSDGRRIASGGQDRNIVIWDAASGTPIRVLTGHRSWIRKLAFSQDGRRIVSESADNEIRLWDAERGDAIGAPLRGFEGEIWSLAFTPDGSVVAGGGDDKAVHLWDVATGEHIAGLGGHESRVSYVAFSRDGRQVISLSTYALRTWETATRELVSAPVIGPEVSSSLAVSGRGDFIVVGGATTLRRWTVPAGDPIGGPMHGHADAVGGVAISADGRTVVSGSMDRTLRFWDAASGASIGDPLTSGTDDVARVMLSADDRRVLSLDIGPDKTVTAWLWPGPSSWHDDLCGKLSHNMSRKQWREWISPEIGYMQVCEGLPIPPDGTG